MKKKNLKLLNILVYFILISVLIIVILPILWIVLSSLQPGSDLFRSTIIPKQITFKHYIDLFTSTDYLLWYKNTLKIALLNMFFGLLLTSITGYIFSKYQFRGKKATIITILLLQMFPSFLAMTAIYIIIARLNLLNSYIGLLLIYVAGGIPFNALIAKGYFDAIPMSLNESAKVDGAGHLTIFFRIIMPVAKPIFVFIALMNFTGPWFDFIFPSMLISDPKKYTLAIGIFAWVSGQSSSHFTMFAAGAILVAVPITLLYLFMQKYISFGLTQGAVK